MKKLPKLQKNLFIVLGFVIAGFLVFHFTSCTPAQAASCAPKPSPDTQNQVVELAPHYLLYSQKALEKAHNEGRVVLYFWAPWCTTCTVLDLELQDKKGKIPEGITILRVNYDEEAELKKQYNIVTQHTFVEVDKEGKVLNKWVGGGVGDLEQYLK